MRVVGGYFRNLTLKYPKDKLRPTTEKVRGAMFNMITANFPDKLKHAKVCDIFAGSGAFGIEALSRGAQKAIFIENNKQTLKTLSENLKQLSKITNHHQLDLEIKVIPTDVQKALDLLKDEQFDIIFLDPPYNQQLIQPVINKIAQYNLLTANGIIVIEHHRLESFLIPENLSIFKQKKYHDTIITIIKKE
ncbi:MAG: 16S rRNA (guanine(966)-N(2))-methyltransferase RsmD [candidate division WOR-3 bacterium]